jgi:hypothetical protein
VPAGAPWVARCVSRSPPRVLSSPRRTHASQPRVAQLRLSQPSSCAILSPSHTGTRLAEARGAEVAAFADLFSAGDYSEGSDSYIALVSVHERSIDAVLHAEFKYARSTLGGGVIDTGRTESRRLCLRATEARNAEACAHKALLDAETEAAEANHYSTSLVEERRQAANKAARREEEAMEVYVEDLQRNYHAASRAARREEEALEVYIEELGAVLRRRRRLLELLRRQQPDAILLHRSVLFRHSGVQAGV